MNLQYRSLERTDIRSTATYSKIRTKICEISEDDSMSFYHPKKDDEFEHFANVGIFWGIYLGSQTEEFLYVSSEHKITGEKGDRVKVVNRKGQEVKFKTFPRFSDSESLNNFIYPFLAKRKSEYYDGSITQEQQYKVMEGLRNLGARILKITNPSHPKNADFNTLCDNILGFRVGVIPMELNSSGQEPGIYVTNTRMISLRAMGEGVANIVGFIVTLLTEDNKLYLVEELENDIHPAALKKLLQLIQEKSFNNQFVISTHSHIVLKYLGIVPDSKLFYINWTPNQNDVRVPTSAISVIDNDPVKRMEILDKLGYEVQDMELHEAYLILEESSAERVIRDFLIPNFVPRLYNRLRTIAANGTSDLEVRVTDFNRLFVYIHTSPIYTGKAWVIADGDDSGKSCIEQLKIAFKSWSPDSFLTFSKDNFERYYPNRFQTKAAKALQLKDRKRRDAKKKLLLEVMEWALNNRDQAIVEFQSSAEEVIQLLQAIDKKLKRS